MKMEAVLQSRDEEAGSPVWCGVSTPVLEYSFPVFFCVKEFTTLVGSLLPQAKYGS